jgi:heme/copper-type cytochrome/quinol oxidase subunit 2
MEEDMNGFRIWTPADNELNLHSKWRSHTRAKAAKAVRFGAFLFLSMAGCGKRTPTYSGPPDTVRQIVMKKWEIVPGRLEFPQGARVELVVSTADVEHGIYVPGLGIREPVQPGKPAVIRFLAETPGNYPMRCSVLCGRGHDRMTGEIVIAPGAAVHK